MKIDIIKKIKTRPEDYLNDEILSAIAKQFYQPIELRIKPIIIPDKGIEPVIFGKPLIKNNALQQMKSAMQLPVVRRGALMPDSHLGYGLPIGAALAAEGSVIPFGIGMDIGCRMSLTIYDCTERFFNMHHHKFKKSIIDNTAFGLTKVLSSRFQEHPFLDRDEFKNTALLTKLKSKAARQLGSSGSGNHFVEWVSLKSLMKLN